MNRLLRATAIMSLLLGTSLAANAADLPPAPPVYRAPPVYAPPQFSWTGVYIGGNLGGGWSRGNVVDSAVWCELHQWQLRHRSLAAAKSVAITRLAAFVIGAEADFDWFANNNNSGNGTTVVIGGVPTVLRASANDRWETTLAARFGYACGPFAVLRQSRRRLGRRR